MHVFTFNRIDDFFGWFLNWLIRLDNFFSARPRVGDWYLTDWDYDNRQFDGVYVVEEVNGDWITTRYRGVNDNYESNIAQTLLVSVLNTCYTRVKPEAIKSFERKRKIHWEG